MVVRHRARGGIVLPMTTKGVQSISLIEYSSGMRGIMLLLLPGKASSTQSRRISGGLSQHRIQL
jgi:hypothetical protein